MYLNHEQLSCTNKDDAVHVNIMAALLPQALSPKVERYH
jgi:hypothetical protein